MKVKYKIIIYFFSLLIFTISIFFIFLNHKVETSSFRIFYRSINNKILSEMKNYDLNIVEASFFSEENVEYLHSNSSKVIGYISLIEIGYWDEEIISTLNEDDYLKDNNGNKLKSLSGTNYLGNLSSKHFREIILNKIEKRILNKNMDGIFLDTLDWIDYYKEDKVIYNKLFYGYKELLIELKQKYPTIIIMQNRGFDSYFNYSKSYITSILFENFDLINIESKKRRNKEFMKFKLYAKIYKTDVYIISFTNDRINRNISSKLNWNYLYSQMEDRYSKWDIEIK